MFQGIFNGISFGLGQIKLVKKSDRKHSSFFPFLSGRGFGLIIASFIYTRHQSKLLFFDFSIANGFATLFYSSHFLFRRFIAPPKPKIVKKNLNIPKIVIEPGNSFDEVFLLRTFFPILFAYQQKPTSTKNLS